MKNLTLLFTLFFCLLFSSFTQVATSHTAYEKISTKEQIVYITKTGKKYHKSSCGHLRKSKIAIEKSKAKELGYTACGTCKP